MRSLCIEEMQALMQSGTVTAVQLATRALSDAENATRDFKAFSAISKSAQTSAAESDKRVRDKSERRLEGIPVAVKDLIDTYDLATVYGSEAYLGHVPSKDAEVVRMLRDQGAVVIGKTTTHEFAWGVTTSSARFGDTLNPLDPARIPGGSSGGAAVAIACGVVPAGLGTDTGGSVRIPASLCGVVGFKPTFGRLPTDGIFPLAPSLDHAGILGASVSDVAALATAFGIKPMERQDSRTFMIGVLSCIQPISPELAVENAFREAVLAINQRFDLVNLEPSEIFNGLFAAFAGIVLTEGGMVHFEKNDQTTISARYGKETYERIERAREIRLGEYLEWQQTRRDFRGRLDGLFKNIDLLVLPTTPCVAPLIGEKEMTIGDWSGSIREALMTYTAPFNMAGYPAISIPMPVQSGEMPCGIQIVARTEMDATLLDVAQTIETIFKNGNNPLGTATTKLGGT